MANNKTEMSNYITLIKNNGSGAGMVGDGDDRLVSVGSGMVGFAHDADGDHERCNGEREGEMASAPVGGRGGFDDNGGGRWKAIRERKKKSLIRVESAHSLFLRIAFSKPFNHNH